MYDKLFSAVTSTGCRSHLEEGDTICQRPMQKFNKSVNIAHNLMNLRGVSSLLKSIKFGEGVEGIMIKVLSKKSVSFTVIKTLGDFTF